jgi:hypothetical protein
MSTYGTIPSYSSLEELWNQTEAKSTVASSPAESSVGGPDISLVTLFGALPSSNRAVAKIGVCIMAVVAAFTALVTLTQHPCAKFCGCVCLTGNATNTTEVCPPCNQNSGGRL